MPYRRFSRNSTRRPRRRYARKPRVSKPVRRYVKRMMPKAELKRVLNQYDEVSSSTLTGGSSMDLTNITQGTALSQRSGTQVYIKGLHIKGVLNNNAAGTNFLRMVIGWVPGQADTTYATSHWFGDNNYAGGTNTVSGIGGLNIIYQPLNKLQIRPVYDKVFRLGPTTDVTGSTLFSKFFKLNKRIKFNANNAGPGYPLSPYQDWSLVAAVFCAESGDDVGVGQIIETSFIARVFFTDC